MFENGRIRSIWDEEEEQWYFSVVDVVAVLTDSVNPRDYWFKMKQRVHSEAGIELSTICRQFKMQAADGKMRLTDTANVKSLIRIIQSIPSPKAEPVLEFTEISHQRTLTPASFAESKVVAKRGGRVAGVARKETEKELGHSVVSSENFLDINSNSSDAID